MSSVPFSNETQPHGFDEGILLLLKAQDSGDWKPLALWLARHPEHAIGIDNFLDGGHRIPALLPARRHSRDWNGTSLGGFELKDEIGVGGMGVVYRAIDTTLKREVAVKLLRSGEALSAGELARFSFEAELVASLHHPNIVPVHSFGEVDGVPYLVMPLMTGGSLAAWLKNLGPDCRLAPKQASKLIRDIALGVHHAHQRGFIHRDLKPGNVLLDDKGRPHVADFGLARRLDVSATTSAGIAGTVAYMAPEQARGDKQLSTAVDVHALGMVLFELLTGGVPYGGSDIASILHRLTDDMETAPPVSRFRPDVPADLEAICAKCLEKRPEDRYLSAQALADALDRFLNDEPQIDASNRGWATDLKRVIGRRVEAPDMASGPGFFWGTVSHIIAQMTIQVAVLTASPEWIAYLGWGVYFGGWVVVIWWFGILQNRKLNRIERVGTAQHIGMMLAGLALIPACIGGQGGYLLTLYPPLMAVVGLGIFAQGAIHWGRYYVLGSLFLLIAALMPLVPIKFWPTVYATPQIMFMVWVGFRIRAFNHEARSPS